MKMHNPPHPGEVLRALCLEPLNLTVTDAARSLGVSRKALSGILNGRAGISPRWRSVSRSPSAPALKAG
jgi:addiction module HigA family antidote